MRNSGAPYEGYPIIALLVYGGGILVFSRLMAFILSHFNWPELKRSGAHRPEDEHLLT